MSTSVVCPKCEKVWDGGLSVFCPYCCPPGKKLAETVDHPSHYGGDTQYETIKVLANWLTEEQLIGFCLGNVIKYLSRSDKKGNRLEDCKKAKWYLDYMVKHLAQQRRFDDGDSDKA